MSTTTESNKRIAKNSIYMSIRMVIVLLISLYTTRCVLEALGIQDYGIYNVVAGFVTMFSFLNNAMTSATQRFYNFELGRNGERGANIVYNASFVIHLLLAIIIVICTEALGLWYLQTEMVIPHDRLYAAECVFHFSTLSMFFTIISVPYSSAIMAHEKMSFYACIGVIDAVLKLAIAFIVNYCSADRLIIYSILFLSVSIFNFLAFYIYAKTRFHEIHLGTRIERSFFISMLSYSGWSLFGAFAYMMREQGVNLLLNAFFGPVVNAARGIANQVNSALNSFSSNIVLPTRPQVIQSYAVGNLDRTYTLTYSISKLSCLFFYMMALPICLEIHLILGIWLGDNVPQYAVSFVIIMLLTNTFGTLVSPISTIIHATGKMRFYQLLSGLSNILTIPLAYLFLRYDEIPELVFVALFITMVTNHLAGLYSAFRICNFSISHYLRTVIIPIIRVMLLSFPIPVIPIYFMEDSIGRMVLVFIISVFSVVIVSYFGALNINEKQLIKSLISKTFNRLI